MRYFMFLIFCYLCSLSNMQAQSGLAEFEKLINGEKDVFLSEGLPKAAGLKLRMEYPKGWTTRDGKRPHVVRFLKSPDLFEMALIGVFRLTELYNKPLEEINLYSKEIKGELLSSDAMKSMLIYRDDVKIEEYNFYTTMISDLQAVFSECKITSPGNANITSIRMYYQTYLLIYNNFYITVQYMVQQHNDETEENFNNRIASYQPLFKLMANSIIVLNQYD